VRAYLMQKADGSKVVRIVKGNEVVKDGDFVMQKLNGPIGGEDILPAQEGRENEFVAFKLDDGTEIKNASEMQKAYNDLYGVGREVPVAPPPTPAPAKEEPRRPGRPRKVEDDEDDEA
jgi:hypothetical protein